MNDYGKEVILDLHECDPKLFNRTIIGAFFDELCKRIDMEPCLRTWWDDLETPEEEKVTEPHLVGTSGVQFILTSNITIHTLTVLRRVYLNVFSCKDFDAKVVADFTREWFFGRIVNEVVVRRI